MGRFALGSVVVIHGCGLGLRASKCFVANARVVDEIIVDLYKVRWVFAAATGDLDDREGECSKARLLRDDDAKALRQVCAAILRFADEPISIQTGSREGAEGRVRELKGEKMGIMPVQRYRLEVRRCFKDQTSRQESLYIKVTPKRQLHVHVHACTWCVANILI